MKRVLSDMIKILVGEWFNDETQWEINEIEKPC